MPNGTPGRGLSVTILQPDPNSSYPSTQICLGISSIVDFVTKHFNDRPFTRNGDYKNIYVTRDGKEVGNLFEIRRRFALWECKKDEYHERNGSRARQRRRGKAGILPTHPAMTVGKDKWAASHSVQS